MVLRGDQRDDPLAIAHHQERKLFALQKFLQHDARAGLAQHLAAQHFFRGAQGFVFGLRDHHALAGSQSVGLDDDRRVEERERRLQLFLLCADGIVRRRNAVALHEFLGETLA